MKIFSHLKISLKNNLLAGRVGSNGSTLALQV
jgi:hypothetical protein